MKESQRRWWRWIWLSVRAESPNRSSDRRPYLEGIDHSPIPERGHACLHVDYDYQGINWKSFIEDKCILENCYCCFYLRWHFEC